METVRVGIVGLGRLGSIHARNLAQNIPGCRLTAACSIRPEELQWAEQALQVPARFTSFEEMVDRADIDAVAIVSSSAEHCRQIEYALDHQKHVFTDKPLGCTIAECKRAEQAVERNPEQIFFLGFMRRFDPSYQYAKAQIDAGKIGTPYMVRAVSLDPEALVEGSIRFAATSGGVFIDMASHDIDLMRWFLGDDAVEVYATGTNFKHPEFAACGDVENGMALFKFQNGAVGTIHAGRTAPHGYHIETEIFGTEGHIRVSPVPAKNLAVLYNRDGVLTECVEGFPERFAEAYRTEMEEFIRCVQERRHPEITVYDGTKSTRMAFAATESFRTGRPAAISYE